MPVTHEPWLVALSLIVAIQGAYVGLSLAVQVGEAARACADGSCSRAPPSRSRSRSGRCISSACWRCGLPFPVDYLVFPDAAVVPGLRARGRRRGVRRQRRPADPAAAWSPPPACMGGGIVSMHYIGMTALHASAHMMHAPLYVVAERGDRHRRVGAGALACGRPRRPAAADPLGDCARRRHLRHALHRDGRPDAVLRTRSRVERARAVDRPARHRRRDRRLRASPASSCCSGAGSRRSSGYAPAPPSAGVQRPGCRRRRGARSADRRHASPARSPNWDAAPMRRSAGPAGRRAVSPAICRSSATARTHFVAVDDVVAVHANAHYTYIFDGTAKLFCPLPIGDVESRLDAQPLRARASQPHRQYRAGGRLKRAGDNGLVELDAPDRYTVPVSRSRVGWLKSRIGSKTSRSASRQSSVEVASALR